MLFFYLGLAASLGLTLVMVVLLGRSLSVNWEMRNRKPAGFLMPVLLTFVLIVFCLTQSVPRMLDTVFLISKTCPTDEIIVDEDTVRVALPSGQALRYSGLQFSFAPGKSYQIMYTPYSYYIIEVTELGESTARE